ncbi:MAG: hypothetical protein QXY45_01040, partial [Candidatus Aenigmatarchaeota archaeon]
KKSEGVIITTDLDDIFESAVIARQALSGEIEPLESHEEALDVLANQIVGITRDNPSLNQDEIFQIIKKAYPYRNLTKEKFLEVLNILNINRYLFLDEKIKPSKKGLLYYFNNLSTIPDTKNYTVINIISDQKVGTLDEEFVAIHGTPGAVFVMKGEIWKIVSVDRNKIFVEPSGELEAEIPGWEGDLMPVPYEVAQEVGRLRNDLAINPDINDLMRRYPVDDSCAKRMVEIIKNQKKFGVVPTDKIILIEMQGETTIIHTCIGTKGNETIGRFLSSILSEKIGAVRLKTDPYRIILETKNINQKLLSEIILNSKPNQLNFYLEKNISESKIFQWRFIHIAKRFGIIRRDAEYGKVAVNRIIEIYSGTPIWEETLREIYTDKLDLKLASDFLRKIKEGKLKLIFKKGISPLGELGLQEGSEIIGSGKPDNQIIEIFSNRLNNKIVRLVCLNCGEWSQIYLIKELPQEIRCQNCKAKLIGLTGRMQTDSVNIIKKKIRGLPLDIEEERRYKSLSQTSDLIIVYGKKAVMALATRGIGPKTAKRVLSRMYEDEKDFLKTLLEAERTFIKNRKYWG